MGVGGLAPIVGYAVGGIAGGIGLASESITARKDKKKVNKDANTILIYPQGKAPTSSTIRTESCPKTTSAMSSNAHWMMHRKNYLELNLCRKNLPKTSS